MRQLPLHFIHQFTHLRWREVMLGLIEGWLSSQSAIDIATLSLEAGSNRPDEIKLASLPNYDLGSALAIVEKLALGDGTTESAARLTWLRLLVAWLHENRALTDEPLAVLEELYADFGYAREIRHLVRYNQTERGAETPELARQRILDDWHLYVDTLRRGRSDHD